MRNPSKLEGISRRRMLSLLGLASVSLTASVPILITTEADAQTPGMERRDDRREGRQDRREGRDERRDARRNKKKKKKPDQT